MKFKPSPKLVAAVGAVAIAAAAPLIVRWEGDVRVGYKDPIGIVTSCVGHTGEGAVLGKKYSEAECVAQLDKDLLDHDEDMMACVDVPLNPYQRAALLSFTFNVGAKKFCGSTLAAKLNAGDYPGACKELLRWTKAGGRELPGLASRRGAEFELCMKAYRPEVQVGLSFGEGMR